MSSSKLMRAMGAPRFDPMPPDQHGYFLHAGIDVDRFVAWVWNGTISINHPTKGFEPRSPYCVNESGQAQKVEDAAAYFDWDPAYARRIQRQAVEQGRVRLDQYRRIYLCGVVKPCVVDGDLGAEENEEDGDADSSKKGEKKAKEKDCTRYVPAYILLKIQERPKHEQKTLLSAEKEDADLFDIWHQDALKACREALVQRQDTRWRAHGLPERRIIQESKQKREAERKPTIQLEFLLTDLVQSSDEEGTVQGRETDAVQSPNRSASLLIETTPEKQQQQRSPVDQVVVVVVGELGVTKARAQAFVTACRHQVSDCTAEEIQAAMEEVERSIKKSKYPNWVPIVLEHAPLKLAAIRKVGEDLRAAEPPKLSPVEDLVVEMNFVRTNPDHPEAPESLAKITRAQEENPELYAAAMTAVLAERSKGANGDD